MLIIPKKYINRKNFIYKMESINIISPNKKRSNLVLKTLKSQSQKNLGLLSEVKLQQTYVFYWQSNCGPYSRKEKQSWQPFDDTNQIHLNRMYEQYSKNRNSYIFNLVYSANDCAVNFIKMVLYDFDSNSICAIKFEEQKNNPILTPAKNVIFKDTQTNINFHRHISNSELKGLNKFNTVKFTKIEIKDLELKNNNKQTSHNEEDFLFFWKSNKDIWDSDESIWTPYDLEDESILKVGFQQFLENNNKNIFNLKNQQNYVDFSKMFILNKQNPLECRPILRISPKLVTNVFRINRFDNPFVLSNVKLDFMENQILNQNEFELFFKNTDKEKCKKINKISFKVFSEFTCKLDIEERICFFENDYIIDIPLQEIKSILLEEINELGKEEGQLPNFESQNIYKSLIESIRNYKSFFKIILYIYTMEGYLYKKINNYLKIYQKVELEKIKYFYISLLASFKYLNKFIKIKDDQDLIVYRASRFSEQEFKQYQNKNNFCMIRIFKEFLSTTSNPQIINSFYNNYEKEIPNIKQFLWHIRIPKEIIKNESTNFADITEFSQFPSEKEILIKSGAIIQIDKIVPYTEKKGNQIIEYKNKYKALCTLKTFSFAPFFKLVSLDPSIKELNLSGNNLGVHEKSMLILKEALEKANSIQFLRLDNNNLGADEKNVFYLKETLEKNNFIKELDLRNNNLGLNDKSMLYLKEAFIKNKSIQILRLENNNLGGNEKCMLYFKEAFEKNSSIEILRLENNNLGGNEKCMLYFKEAFEKNFSIKDLNISNNKLGGNEKNILYLKEALENNKSIQKLNLGENFFGGNEKILLYLKEALVKNKTIEELKLSSNYLSPNEKNLFRDFKNIKIDY